MDTGVLSSSTSQWKQVLESRQSEGSSLKYIFKVHQNIPHSQSTDVSLGQKTTHTTSTVIGVLVPLIVVGIVLMSTTYIWYRRKYPVRKAICEDFARFPNLARNTNASAQTFARDNAHNNLETNDCPASRVLALAEANGDNKDSKHEIHFQEVNDGDETSAKKSVLVKHSDVSSSCDLETNNEHKCEQKACLMQAYETIHSEDELDSMTESAGYKRTESDVNYNNDIINTHTICLPFTEASDNRLAIKANINCIKNTNKNNGKRSVKQEIGQLNDKDITVIAQKPIKHDTVDQVFSNTDSNIYENFEITVTEKKSDTGLLTKCDHAHLNTQKLLLDKQNTELISTNLETLEYHIKNEFKNNFKINEEKNMKSTSENKSSTIFQQNSHELQMRVHNSLNSAMLEKRLTFSTENLYFDSLPTPTVLVHDSIIFEPDLYQSQIFIKIPPLSPSHGQSALTLSDIAISKIHGYQPQSFAETDERSVRSPTIYDNDGLRRTDKSNRQTTIENTQIHDVQENTLMPCDSNTNECHVFESKALGENNSNHREFLNVLNNSYCHETICETQKNDIRENEIIADSSEKHMGECNNKCKDKTVYHKVIKPMHNNKTIYESQCNQACGFEFSQVSSNIQNIFETSINITASGNILNNTVIS